MDPTPDSTLPLLTRLSGTIANMATVTAGTGLGLLLRARLPARMQEILVQALGLTTLAIAFEMARSLNAAAGAALDGVVLGLMALVAGGLLGEWARLDDRLQGLGEWLKRRVRGRGDFAEGFVAASLLFCVGPLTLIGSLNNGLTGDDRLLLLKAIMDGIAAIALTGSFGVGVGFSVLTIAAVQGGIALGAGWLAAAIADPAADPRWLMATGVGGLTVAAIGLNLLGVTAIRVASFLPALVLGPLFYAIAAL